jgi:hypothetical protein
MNKTQLQTTAASLVGVAAGYAAGHDWLGLSVGDWTTVIGAIVAAGSVLWPALVTREQSLKNTVGNMKLTTVVTDEASAKALPDNKDVVAVTPAIVAAIKASNPS